MICFCLKITAITGCFSQQFKFAVINFLIIFPYYPIKICKICSDVPSLIPDIDRLCLPSFQQDVYLASINLAGYFIDVKDSTLGFMNYELSPCLCFFLISALLYSFSSTLGLIFLLFLAS